MRPNDSNECIAVPAIGFRLLVFPVAFCLAGHVASAVLPFAHTQPAGPIRATSATLNGMAVANLLPTTAWFEWGTNTDYGTSTDPQNIGSGFHVVRVSAPIPDLTVGGVYHFRLVASNSTAVVLGFDSIFTTSMRVQNWGSYSFGSPVVPPGLTNLAGIACGHGHGLALRNDGTVAAWMVGFIYPNYGQTNVPPGLSNVIAVAGGYSHSMALKEDGTVVAWGKYASGTPADVPANLTNVIAIAGGDYHSVALKADGKLVSWGNPPSPEITNIPATVVDIVGIACGSSHTLALKADGTVFAWRDNTPPSYVTNMAAITTMASLNLGLKGDGTVVDWGATFSIDIPKPPNLTNIVGIATGTTYYEVLNASGIVQGWGRAQDVTNIPPGLSNVIAIASGDYHRVGLASVDLPPIALPRFVSGGVNTAFPISLTAFDPNGDLLSFRITSLPTNGVLYQYQPGGPGLPITLPGTLVTDASRVIFVPSPDTSGNPFDSFSFSAIDRELEGVSAPCTVAILPRPVIQAAGFTNGISAGFALSFVGVTNTRYTIWGSSGLGPWSFLGSATQVSPGQFSFTDYTFTNSPVRFYRLRSP